MDQQMDQGMAGQKCPCPHHKMVPIWIVVLGLVFLLGALHAYSPSVTGILWPIVVIIIGLQKIFEHSCKCCNRM